VNRAILLQRFLSDHGASEIDERRAPVLVLDGRVSPEQKAPRVFSSEPEATAVSSAV
jgi:hypothetical protein